MTFQMENRCMKAFMQCGCPCHSLPALEPVLLFNGRLNFLLVAQRCGVGEGLGQTGRPKVQSDFFLSKKKKISICIKKGDSYLVRTIFLSVCGKILDSIGCNKMIEIKQVRATTVFSGNFWWISRSHLALHLMQR